MRWQKRIHLLQQAVSEFYGLRNIGIPDLFEALCWGILGQQINLTYAYTLKRRFVETFGSSIEWEGQSYWIFPEPEDIAKLTVEDLSSLKMTVKKCEYLIGVAQLIADGSLSKAQVMGTGDFKQAEKMLVKIRGVGPWTANYVLMRCLRFPNAFPIADVGLHNAIKHLTGAEEKPTKEEILKLAAPWAELGILCDVLFVAFFVLITNFRREFVMSNYYRLAQYFHYVNYSIDNVQAIQSTDAATER